MVGSAIAMDLHAGGELAVTVADRSDEALARVGGRLGVQTLRADLADPEVLKRAVRDHDLVVGALPSFLGITAMRAIIEEGKPCCDISFMAEDPVELGLGKLAEERGVTVVYDCGIAPGMSNMMAAYGAAQLDACERIDIYVGGLPVVRRWPYEYKAPFSPCDVLEEYTRPARLVEHGQVVVREALSEPELLDFAEVGTLEAFNTDGLRSLVRTLPAVPFMREKTMRYPGHIALMRALRETGLFSKEPITVGGQQVRPLDVTSALLFPKWAFEEGEADMTVMRVTVEGQRAGKPARLAWDLVDRLDPATGTRSMSRTTGFTATAMARLLLAGRFVRPGVHPPEVPALEPGIFDAMLRELDARGVRFTAQADAAG